MHRTHRHAQRYPRLQALVLFAALLAPASWLPALAAVPATRVADINTHQTNPAPAPNDSSTPQHLIAVGNTLYFSADDGGKGHELWKSDVAGNATLVKNIRSASASSHPAELTEFKGALFFTADDGSGRSIWKSNGVSSGTALITTTDAFSMTDGLTKSGNVLFFSAASGTNGCELWITDGTATGTALVKDINSGTASSSPSGLADVNGTLFFAATEGISNTELWKSDGTITGTLMVKDINPGIFGPPGSSPSHLTDVNGTLYFAADDGSEGVELWKSDGTITSTLRIKDINAAFPGASSSPASLTAVGTTLFFTANDGVHGTELWKSDGTAAGTTLVKDIYAGAFDASPSNLTNVNGTVYFTANDGVSGIELWKSDGTPGGTVQVKDIYSGAPDSSPSHLANINGMLLFAANDGVSGIELWKSRGTQETTLLVQNIASGAGDSNPSELTTLSGSVFFRASDDIAGAELWSILPQPNGLNFAPIAANTTVSAAADLPVSSTLPATDPDGNALMFSIVTNGTKGTALIDNSATGAFTYTPNAGVSGTDTFTFKANDGQIDSNVAIVTITIGAPNQPPVAGNATITTAFNVQYSGTLGATDPEGSALTYSIATNGSKGVARITDATTGAFTYTPNAGASGGDSFTFQASDGQLDSNTATISATIGNPKVYLPFVVR
jgi:ELWxxDGT repeat protein